MVIFWLVYIIGYIICFIILINAFIEGERALKLGTLIGVSLASLISWGFIPILLGMWFNEHLNIEIYRFKR